MSRTVVGVALAYVGAVVGAGFASGQEIYQFFSRHGTWGLAGVIAAGMGFASLGALALRASQSGVTNFEALLRSSYPPRWVPPLTALATVMLAVGLVVVTAAAGQTVETILGGQGLLWGLVSLLGMIIVAERGAQGLLRANALLVPLLLAVSVIVAVWVPGRLTGAGAPRWWLSASLYVSYNLFTGLMVLLGLGTHLRGRGEAKWAAGLAGGVLAAVAFLIHRAILGMDAVGAFPLLDAAHRLGGGWSAAYAAALYAALFTTGAAEAFALSERFGRRVWWALLAWPASRWGFANLVAELYPVMGLLALLFWAPLMRWVPVGTARPRG